MRLLERNKQTIYYRNLESTENTTVTDEYGNILETGENTKTYGDIMSTRAYVKSAIGENSAEPFGDFTSKRRTIYTQDEGINEYSILWVGIDPEIVDGAPTKPHNFTVDGVSDGINHRRILIRKVEASV